MWRVHEAHCREVRQGLRLQLHRPAQEALGELAGYHDGAAGGDGVSEALCGRELRWWSSGVD